MLNQQPYEKLFLELKDELASVEESILFLQKLFRNLPVSEAVKKSFTDATLKEKSAWYACLINHNIDVLLLPEYLESKQCRNILLKKETDQYFKSIEHFDLLGGKVSSELFECILRAQQDVQKASGVDLFSSQVVETAKCPESLTKLMSGWSGKFNAYGKLGNILFQFLEWHSYNNFSFSTQRQIVLWLNYQFRNAFGNISYRFNHEKYFFHHWNKESRDMKNSLKEMLLNWKQEANALKQDLLHLYRTSISFENLKPSQKVISNHLFSEAFSVQYPKAVQISQYPALKPLLRRGFVELTDFGGKENFEKYRQLLDELVELNFISPMSDDEIFIGINPSYQSMKGRLSAYSNTKLGTDIVNWDEFIGQNITPTKPINPVIEEIRETQVAVEMTETNQPEIKPVRKKAFFG